MRRDASKWPNQHICVKIFMCILSTCIREMMLLISKFTYALCPLHFHPSVFSRWWLIICDKQTKEVISVPKLELSILNFVLHISSPFSLCSRKNPWWIFFSHGGILDYQIRCSLMMKKVMPSQKPMCMIAFEVTRRQCRWIHRHYLGGFNDRLPRTELVKLKFNISCW